MFYSPLRYPGGKSKLTPYVLETMKLNNLEGGTYVEPFAGGAAIAWYLLINKHVEKVFINDLNKSIYAFWHSVLFQTDQLCSMIEAVDITIDNWEIQKAIQKEPDNYSLLDLGFSTFFLNRTNRSGIIKGGAIGGMTQEGNYKLDCRFNRKDLINRIIKISNCQKDIHLTNLDANEFILKVLPSIPDKCLVNIDPPYYKKGKGLYQNFFEHSDHFELYNNVIKIRQPWMVTYDDTPEINKIYKDYNPLSFSLSYTAQVKRKGFEVLIHKSENKTCEFEPNITFKELSKLIKNTSKEKFKNAKK